MKRMMQFLSKMLTGGLLLAALSVNAHAASTAAEITGEIERLTLDDPANVYSGGVMIVGGTQVILPKNLLIDLPANRLSLQQIFTQAPAACVALGESGLAKSDKCNSSGGGGFATLSGVHSNAGNVIAGDVLIEKGKEVVSGVVSYINYSDGYFRVNGIQGDAATGVMVRLNDPTSKHTVQQGAGCAGGPNCSPDPRFTLDPDNYTNAFSSGYPLCIPSAVARNIPAPGLPALAGGVTPIPAVPAGLTQADAVSGAGDRLCPSANRTPGVVTEPDVADSRLFAPIVIGDSLNSEGNYETINGTRFLSAHTTRVNKALSTKNQAGQPDYMFLEEVFVEAPGFQNQRARMLIIGFTTLAPTDVDFWTIHRDPTNNAVHEFPLASIQGCDNAAGAGSCGTLGLGGGAGAGGNIFRIRYDVDFLLARNDPQGRFPGGARNDLNPCWQLLNSPRFSTRVAPAPTAPGLCPGATAGTTTGAGITLENNFGIMSPIPHEIQARTGHLLDAPVGSLVTLDISGNTAANGQYLFPFGMNLGGIETADFLEVDINLLNTPRVFEGIPWNLDRRLSPSGCLNNAGVPAPCPGGALGSFALDPFPYTGLDPRLQAQFLVAGQQGGTPKGPYNDPNFTTSVLNTPTFGASNRVFTYVTAATGKANGNATVLPYVLGVFPADPPLIAINPTPVLNIFPPIADEDAATTTPGVPVTINVTLNDFPVLGIIDPASVKIVSGPASGTAVVNLPAGTITFTPTDPLVSSVSFTYSVANNFGSISDPGTVTVTIVQPVTAVSLTPDKPSPGTPGNAVTFVASATGTTGTYSYQFWLHNGISWTMVRDYSTSSSWTWDTTGRPVGPYTVQVTAKNTGSSTAFDAFSTLVYTLNAAVIAPPPATGATLAVSPASPQGVGTSVIFAAGGVGGSGTYEYEFWRNDGVAWTKVQSFTPVSTWVWNTTAASAGVYTVQVNVRSAGSTASFEGVQAVNYTLTAASAATGVTIVPDKTSPQLTTTPGGVTFTAAGQGGTGSYEYEFWLNNGVSWTKRQNMSTSSAWNWNTTLETAGTYTLQVNVRSIGSTAPLEAFQSTTFQLQ